MNFKTIGFGLAAAVAVTTSTLLTATSATALSVGDTLTFSTDEDSQNNLATFTNNVLNFGIVEIDDNSVFGNAGTVINFSDLNLQSITPSSGAVASWTLADSTPYQLITGLNDELGGTTRVFKLTSFILNQESQLFGQSAAYTALFDGFFEPPVPGLPGHGGLGTYGKLAFNGTSISGQITVVPTPALLPGLIGMGVAAVRRKKQKELA